MKSHITMCLPWTDKIKLLSSVSQILHLDGKKLDEMVWH
jgi:hypothetical protein